MSYKTQVEDIIGTVGDDSLITQSLLNAGAKIIDATPRDKLMSSAVDTSITSSGLDVSDKKVIEVVVSGTGARLVTNTIYDLSNDPTSIYQAGSNDPAYVYKGEKIFVTMGGTDTTGTCFYVPKIPTTDGSTAITHASSSVANFPLEAESIMVLGASILCLQRLISDRLAKLKTYVQTDEDSELAQTEMLEVQAHQSLLASLKAEYDQAFQIYIGTTN